MTNEKKKVAESLLQKNGKWVYKIVLIFYYSNRKLQNITCENTQQCVFVIMQEFGEFDYKHLINCGLYGGW